MLKEFIFVRNGLHIQRYKLLKWDFVNRKTNKTIVAAFAVILDERMDTYKEVIETFQQLYEGEAPKFFFVDKDFTQDNVLTDVYQKAGCPIECLYCLFHTLK